MKKKQLVFEQSSYKVIHEFSPPAVLSTCFYSNASTTDREIDTDRDHDTDTHTDRASSTGTDIHIDTDRDTDTDTDMSQ